jgi:hypothetical protein
MEHDIGNRNMFVCEPLSLYFYILDMDEHLHLYLHYCVLFEPHQNAASVAFCDNAS